MADHPFLEHPGPIAYAHRGGAATHPENTWAAFRHAVDLGFRYLETDVRLTRDGVPVLFHDATLDRVTDRRGRLRDLTWRELAGVRVAGSEPIVRLDDLLDAFPAHRVNLDVKHDDAVDPLGDLLARVRALDRVCVASFRFHRLQRLRARFGERLCTSAAPGEVASLRLSPSLRPTGAARFLQVPVRLGRFRVVGERLLAAATRQAVPVHVWTVDDPEDMHRLLDLGVSGLMTDRPSVLRAVLQERGQWHRG